MSKLQDMPNIGKELEKKLEAVGVETPEALKELGSREAFDRIRLVYPDACLCSLCALEGAVNGIRWHYLPEETKFELKDYFKKINK